MLPGFYRRVLFLLERFIVRSALHQLLFIAGLIVLVSVVSGTVVYLTVPEFGDYLGAVWWGFLRLSDPGYLGDDEGAVARTVSTIVTVLGYVLFMGALIAIMNQGLGRMMRRLESGVTPISLQRHILILGWTNRTQTIIRELLMSKGRVQRFLDRMSADRLKIVVMAEEVTAELAYELKTSLGSLWDQRTLILRSGNPLHREHLERVDFLNAAAIILPASDFSAEGTEALDARIIKTILSVSNANDAARPLPILTTELFDARKIPIAEAAYAGDIEIVPNSTLISRLIAQNVRHSGLSGVYSELLTHGEGNEIYVRECPALVGTTFGELWARFSSVIPLGVIRPDPDGDRPLLNPPADLVIAAEDRLAFIADRYDAIESAGENTSPGTADSELRAAPKQAERRASATRKVLFLGWSHKTPALLSEFQSYSGEAFSVTTVSRVPAEERRTFIERFAGELPRLQVEHIEADYTAPYDLENLAPQEFDNVVFLASDWLASGEESDARTILGYLLLRRLMGGFERRPDVLIELMDPENQALFANRPGEILVSPLILSHMLAHITLRRDLRIIFEELFTTGGAEIFFRSPLEYLDNSSQQSFRDIQRRVAAHGDIALGIYQRDEAGNGKRCLLNPARDSMWSLTDADELVVLTTYA